MSTNLVFYYYSKSFDCERILQLFWAKGLHNINVISYDLFDEDNGVPTNSEHAPGEPLLKIGNKLISGYVEIFNFVEKYSDSVSITPEKFEHQLAIIEVMSHLAHFVRPNIDAVANPRGALDNSILVGQLNSLAGRYFPKADYNRNSVTELELFWYSLGVFLENNNIELSEEPEPLIKFHYNTKKYGFAAMPPVSFSRN